MPDARTERELMDRLWDRVRSLLPPSPPQPKGGRPFADDRACFEGIVYLLRNGLRWRQMPACYPSGVTCWRRHKAWTEAVCNSIKDALGVTCVATPIAEFSDFRKQINSGTMKGMFRTGWQMDYPSIENFLAPLYGTGAGSNDSGYSNPDFDKKLTEAAAATDPATANKDYQDAEALLAADMPVIPMWYSTATVGWSDKVTNVKVTPFGTFDLSAVSLK